MIAAFRESLTAELARRRRLPEATYRLQFNAGFTFQDARRIVPYLHALGVTDCYASPYLKARPGSLHGYDIIDHRTLNPEIGSEEDYNAWVAALHEHGLGQVLDLVPNHMGVVGNGNAWWNDVLENGPASPYAGFFDITWHALKPDLHDKVLLPLLGEPYGRVLEAGQLRLGYEAGAFTLHYFDHRFPVSPDTYHEVLAHRLDELRGRLGEVAEPFIEYQSILTAISHLPDRTATDAAKVAERQREKEVVKRRLATLTEQHAEVRSFIEENINQFNGTPGVPHSFDLLDQLLGAQAYRLAFWRVAADEINYRRFFDINELAALSMEKPEVFAAAHELVLRLLAEGKITGLRIDHPDGLYDPKQYLRRLQEEYAIAVARRLYDASPPTDGTDWPAIEQAVRGQAHLGRPLYVVVEKILGRGESLPDDWPVYGTTGYEFLNALNGLFVDADQRTAMDKIYHRWIKSHVPFRDLVYQKKFLILQVALAGELHVLGHQLDRISEQDRWSRDFTLNSLRHALREIIACFPVYRSYITAEGPSERDAFDVIAACARAKRKNPAISASLFDFIRDLLLLQKREGSNGANAEERLRFVGKFQQVTSPVMAKGLEDTAFYVYNRLVSLNEVGGDPEQFGVSVADFHVRNHDRQARWAHALSATATHDTKRGEDVRARINVLSEMPHEWRQKLSRWHRLNKRHRVGLEDEGAFAPDRNDEYFFYQTLVGAWPNGNLSPEQLAAFAGRVQDYLQKAVHEAKVHSSWINPNPAYDEAVRRFVARAFDNRTFLDDFRAFQRRVSHYGAFNSLSQTLLKLTSPGAPDTYQGTELWDFSLVDPDNRQPVDYELRQRLLGALQARTDLAVLARELVETKDDGRIKLYVTYRALQNRRERPGLFSEGKYLTAEAHGERAEHVCAFVRRQGQDCAVVVVPRLPVRLLPDAHAAPCGEAVWDETYLLMPGVAAGTPMRNIFTGEMIVLAEHNGRSRLRVAEVLAQFPIALLV